MRTIVSAGGGVIGASIAYALTRRRVGRVVVLEKAFLGAGSSGKSGAIIRQHYSNALTVAMARKSLRFFEQFHDIVGGPAVFTHTGMVIVINQHRYLRAHVFVHKDNPADALAKLKGQTLAVPRRSTPWSIDLS